MQFNYFQIMIKSYLFVCLLVLIYGCSFFVEPKGTFVVKNDSDYKLDITFFSKSKVVETLVINSKEQYKSTILIDYGGTTTPFNGTTDSIIIKFDNLRYIKQYCQGFQIYANFGKCDFKKNLIDFETGVTKRNKITGFDTKTITFDNSDFDKAIPL